MFDFLRKLGNTVTPTKTRAVTLHRAYGQFSDASHIMKSDADWTTLCGVAVVKKSGVATTSEEIVESLPRQHPGFFYCGKCVEEVTGIPDQEVRGIRERNGKR